MRRIIIGLGAVCAVGLILALHFRSALLAVPPPPSAREEPPRTHSQIFHTLSAAQKARILDGDFSIEKKVDHLPNGLKSAFAGLAGEHNFKMANPGEKYQATDFIGEPGLPSRRLLFAGIAKDKCFIHYEKGGRGHSYHVAVFGVEADGKVKVV